MLDYNKSVLLRNVFIGQYLIRKSELLLMSYYSKCLSFSLQTVTVHCWRRASPSSHQTYWFSTSSYVIKWCYIKTPITKTWSSVIWYLFKWMILLTLKYINWEDKFIYLIIDFITLWHYLNQILWHYLLGLFPSNLVIKISIPEFLASINTFL